MISSRLRRRWFELLALTATLVAGVGCRRGQRPPPPRLALGEITVRDVTPPEGGPARLDVEALRAEVRSRLAQTQMFELSPRPRGAGEAIPELRTRVEIALDGAQAEGKALARVLARVRMVTRPSDAPGAIDEDLQAQGARVYELAAGADAGVPAPDVLFSRLASKTVADLLDGFTARQRLKTAPVAEVHRALTTDGGAEVKEEAARLVAERRLREEIPTLLVLLNDPEERVRDAALGALLELKERRAVTTLTQSRSLRDRREMRKILDAISTLGGDEARDYLSFVAESHDDEEIRQLAAAARARLDRRAEAPASR